MLFDKVTDLHIKLGIKDFEEKGLPNGFGPSTTYDLIYLGKRYPPKAIMAYANYHAEGRKIERYFKGGDNTECFQVLRAEGFQVVPKDQEMKQINVKQEFVKWLIENPRVNYYNNDPDKLEKELDRYNDFFDIDIFNANNLKEIRSFLNNELYKKPTSPFLEFSEKTSRHLPRDVLGNKNYFEFLDEKFKNMNNNKGVIFTWVPTHKELTKYLLTKEHYQEDIIKILDAVGIDPLNDQEPKGQTIKLQEIEPFTFFCYIYKYGDARRLQNIQNIAKELNLTIPTDERGVPSAYAQKVWLFPYKYNRVNNEIKRLWQFFKDALNKSITDDKFADILTINNVGKVKITEGLFYIMPEDYFPINGPAKDFLKEKLNISPEFNSYSEYQNILRQIKEKTDKPFYELSFDAWKWNHEKSKSQSNEKVLFNIFDSFEIYLGNLLSFKNNPLYSKAQISGKVGGTKSMVLKFWKRHFDEEFNPLEINLKKLEWLHNLTLGTYPGTFTGKQNFRDFIKILMMKYDQNYPLNQILYGPPGTGKTYNTINESLKILEPDFYNENEHNREALNKRFKELLIKDFDNTKGQIAFCTFHQSFSYEDFVEGIKPKTNENKDVYYEIEDGIFKNICQLANSSISASKFQKENKLSWDEDQFKKASFYKLSLGEAKNPDDRAIYEYCRDNSVIALGFGDDTNLSNMSESEIYEKCEELELGIGTAQRLSYFIHYLKQGSYVVVSNGNRYVRCLGKVIGDYEFVEESPISYHHFRKVEWLFVDENIPVEEIYDRNFSQKTIYKLDENKLKSDFFVNKGQHAKKETKREKDYVLVIDEINRGNVSSIFGELITLIEPDKRAGGKEELEVILPYSKEPFKVPHNVYLVGTMNTADRSIEALDTALRRRFAFIEKPPISKLILTEGDSGKVNGIVDGINLKVLLDTINGRIEKLIDKDHKIGHSYFLKVNDNKSLINCFENEVIPLLEEYFFGDYGKIGLVLGDSFIKKINTDFEFASFEGYDSDVTTDLKERSVYKIKKSKDWNFSSI